MGTTLRINGRSITSDSRPYLIAEIGHNHQGNLDLCLQLIEAAAASGADAVKLQKRSNEELFTKAAYEAPYNSENAFGDTYGMHRRALEFGIDEYLACAKLAASLGVDFFATAFDFASADFLEDLGVPAFKIASGDLKSTPLLKHIAAFGKPIIISTGGGNMQDIDRAVAAIESQGNDQIAILQCTAGYPPSYDELNLRVIEILKSRFPSYIVGYSGHDSGIAMAVVAQALGARIIEKHFTLNRAMKGTDHAFSLEPAGFRKLSRDIKRTHEALGDGVKRAYESEGAPLRKMGKMIVAAKELAVGHYLTSDDVAFKSPCEGLPPYRVDDLLGRRLVKALGIDEAVLEEHLEK